MAFTLLGAGCSQTLTTAREYSHRLQRRGDIYLLGQ